ncbi:uncharacterized protein LOC130625179 [Hydractinia symbiolongicarpus]|uniref:uncharacterized protein LOC130625179 n=1 Tax=Hydractinia symbiolongicarpus TaxID=13093 RepID=UPI002549C614|nr:uncharacterized protein LOC130625179 [Hydractinia symbiolongicarpus]
MASFWRKNCNSNTTKQVNRDQVKTNVPSIAKFIDKDDVFRLILREGKYPYEYMDNWQKFEELELPPKKAFYSKLNMKGISDNDYAYAKEPTSSRRFEASPWTNTALTLHTSTAHLAWHGMHSLKFTSIRLEVLTDPDMLLMFEKGICGGIVQAVHRYAKANNKYMGDQYIPNEESSYLHYLDANNLYGCAMRQDSPTDGFKRGVVLNFEAFTERRIGKLVDGNKHGYILEVDIGYPKALHDKHNELPFLPERKMIHKVEKLVPNLSDKRRCVVHIRALHEAIKPGLELKKVHRVIRFNQKAWLKVYIDHNTRLRTNAKNKFEKDFYKLMNLSVFGKTMENIRNHRNIQLVTNEEKYTKLVMKPNFKDVNRFSKHLLGVEMGKTEVKMNKPVQNMVASYSSVIWTQDVEKRFDTSAYNPNDGRPLPIGKNKKVVGLMKDELGGKVTKEFITLRAKAYAYKSLTKKGGDRKAKGVRRCVTKKSITFDDYQRCLEEGVDIYKSQILIQNKVHKIYNQEVLKLALNRADDKRIVQLDQITTLARGHYRLTSTGE